jgi:hypothetical protein
MGRRRNIHAASLTWFPIFCKIISSEPFPSGRPYHRDEETGAVLSLGNLGGIRGRRRAVDDGREVARYPRESHRACSR